MSKFQQALEDARYEVSIELYPHGLHYQIYKPSCSGAHCWEVYRNPRTDDEIEATWEIGGVDTLDDALSVMNENIGSAVMSDERFRRFDDAINVVCGECAYVTVEECESCMVRKTFDMHRDRRETP